MVVTRSQKSTLSRDERGNKKEEADAIFTVSGNTEPAATSVRTGQVEPSTATMVPGTSGRLERAASVRTTMSTAARRQELKLRIELEQQQEEEARAAAEAKATAAEARAAIAAAEAKAAAASAKSRAAAAITQMKLEMLQLDEEEGVSIFDDEEDADRTKEVYEWVENTVRENPNKERPPVDLHAQVKQEQPVKDEEQGSSKDLVNALITALNQRNHIDPPKYLHELPYFDGDCDAWLAFKTVYEDTAHMFSKVQNMARLRKCLKGTALEAVKSILYSEAPPEEVIDGLRRRFGRPDTLVRAEMEKLKALSKLSDNPRDVCIFASQVSNSVAAIKGLKKPQYLHSPEITKLIVDKMPPIMRYQWYVYASELDEEDESTNLAVISKFLNREADRCGAYAEPESSKKKSQVSPRHQVNTTTERSPRSESREECPHCAEKHRLLECKKFLQASKQERWDIVRKTKTCFKCLVSRHRRENCRRPPCKICRRYHHPLLHEDSHKNDSISKSEPETSEGVSNVVNTLSCSRAFLKMVPVEVFGPKGTAKVLALLDDGSSISLLDSEVARLIGATGPEEILALETVGGKKLCNKSMRLDLDIRGIHQGQKRKLRGVRTMDSINLASQKVDENTLQGCKHLQKLAKQLTYTEDKPKLLIGQDNWGLIVSRYTRKGKANQPVASLTSLGWVLHGCDGGAAKEVRFENCAHLAPAQETDLEALIKEHFSLESLGVEPRRPSTDAEGRALAILEEKSKRLPEGRYESGLLWKSPDEIMPDNYKAATVRLFNIEKKLDKDEGLKKEYGKQIQHLLESGYAEEAPQESSSPRKWYLPHFAVVHPLKKKVRIVFDAAAKVEGKSLNDALLAGPDLLQSLFGVLLRFRQWPIAVVADIKEMFLRIKMNTEDRDSLRFLWRGDNRSGKPKEYRMTSVIFGAASSPSTAIFVKNKNASEFAEQFPEAARAIEKNHYMDDYLQSFRTEKEASKVAKEVDFIHKQAGFELRGWASNRASILKGITDEANKENVDLGDQEEKTLGLRWVVGHDTLKFHTSLRNTPEEVIEGQRIPTKREVTSAVMSTFDPLGLISPVLIQGKKLIQEIWRSGIGWDEPISEQNNQMWQEYLRNLEKVCNLEIQRVVASSSHEGELHVFSDASETACAAAVYLRTRDKDSIQVRLLAGKAKVTPLKLISIPRLELQAALLGCRLAKSVKEELDLKVTATTYWTDSSTVLAWIKSDPRSFKPFVAHRLAEIEDSTKPQQWRWVPTSQNPADDATRSIPDGFSSEHRWFIGPEFLRLPEENWPKPREIKKELTGEEKKFGMVTATTMETHALIPDFTRFSSWTRLLRATARVFQFIDVCRPGKTIGVTRSIERDPTWKNRKVKKTISRQKMTLPQASKVYLPIEDNQLLKAEQIILKKIQEDSFATEIKALQGNHPFERSSRLYRLDVGLEPDGLLRLRGRVNAVSGLGKDFNSPILLCGKHPISKLLIADYHKKFNHGNHATVMNEIQQRYWILGLRTAVRQVAHNCQWCRVQRATPNKLPTGDLPPERLRHGKYPFTCTAVDYFGPMIVTVGRRHEKRWGALFTCLTTRAVHIELASSLTADSMILALIRMTTRRGTPEVIFSDNGTNFVRSNKELQEAFNKMKKEEIIMKAEERGIRWKFIPPGAPNMGGAWERMVRSIKTALAATLRERTPREEVLHTLLLEAEHLVNSRPLTDITYECGEEALTPNHFLIGRSCGARRLGQFSDTEIDGRLNWKSTQRLADHFWSRWVKEYLPTLLPRRSAPGSTKRDLQEGDIVLLVDSTMPRGTWPRGEIIRTYPGPDRRTRIVDIRTSGGILRRPASKLVLLVPRAPPDPEISAQHEGENVGDGQTITATE